MIIPLIDLRSQLEPIQAELETALLDTLNNTKYIIGPQSIAFETEFAEHVHCKHAIGVANGTDALIIALKALGIKVGDEVITSPFTFFATAEAIAFVGATPVFVDVQSDSFNIDPSLIESKITSKTKAIIPVHIFGQPCAMEEIMSIAKKHNLYVIEDACQAVGSTYKSQQIGSIGDISCFSFFPTKNLGCAGDGGMITTNNDHLATICKALRVHGSGQNGKVARALLEGKELEKEEEITSDNTVYNPMKYYNYLIGHNSRLDEMQAAILNVKLPHLDAWNIRRAKIAETYQRELKGTRFVMPTTIDEVSHVYHMFVIQSETREKDIKALGEKGISTGVYYPVPLHLQKAFEDLGYKEGDFPIAEYLSKRTFAIPVYPEMTDEQVAYVIEALREIA